MTTNVSLIFDRLFHEVFVALCGVNNMEIVESCCHFEDVQQDSSARTSWQMSTEFLCVILALNSLEQILLLLSSTLKAAVGLCFFKSIDAACFWQIE